MLIGFDLKQKIKELLRVKKKIPDYFDLGVAFWLLDPDGNQYVDKTKTIGELHGLAAAKLKENGLEKVFYEIEMPLLRVLAEMEMLGIQADPAVFHGVDKDLDKELVNS